MLNVSSALRDFYLSENPNRHLVVTFGEGDDSFQLSQKQILAETMELKEALQEDSGLEFVGCISSQFRLQIANVKHKLKNRDIHVSIYCEEGTIPLFHGYIDSDERTANRRVKELIAYDAIYQISGVDVTEFVNRYSWPATFKQFRDDFFQYIGIEQKPQNLDYDYKIIEGPTQKEPTEEDPTPLPVWYLPENQTLTAADVIRSLCQAAGVFGIMNRYNHFEYRTLAKYEEDDGAFPGIELIPPFFPGVASEIMIADAQFYPSYRSLSLETYNVNKLHTVVVKQNDDSSTKGVFDDLGNKYTVLGNLFTMYGRQAFLDEIARGIYRSIHDIDYTPFAAECIGLPFLEVGDAVQFYVYDFEESEKQKDDVYIIQTFFVLSRTMTGIRSTKDVLSASGEKAKRRVSDLGIRLSEDKTLEQDVKEVKEESKQTAEKVQQLEDDMLKCFSVDELPGTTRPNSIYLIKGTVG